MKTITFALIAMTATLTAGAANADETAKMDVIVVTAARPDTIEAPKLSEADQAAPTIDFAELTIEMPHLETAETQRERIELALNEDPAPKS
jgi:hypothetical protein